MRSLCFALLAPLACAAADWVRHTPGAVVPGNALILDAGVAACRARLADGNLHPGVDKGNGCEIPQKGKVERAPDFEILVDGTARWAAGDWDAAFVIGRQGRSDLYLCRAAVSVGGIAAGWAYGKAYGSGPHARHCYVGVNGREIDLSSNFEILTVARADAGNSSK